MSERKDVSLVAEQETAILRTIHQHIRIVHDNAAEFLKAFDPDKLVTPATETLRLLNSLTVLNVDALVPAESRQ